MSIDLSDIFGGHHQDTGHDRGDQHDTEHDSSEPRDEYLLDLPLFASGAPLSSAHAVGHNAYPIDAFGYHGTNDQAFHDHRDHPVLDETPDLQIWRGTEVVEHGPRLHIVRHSEALNSDHDGVGDAASRDMRLTPTPPIFTRRSRLIMRTGYVMYTTRTVQTAPAPVSLPPWNAHSAPFLMTFPDIFPSLRRIVSPQVRTRICLGLSSLSRPIRHGVYRFGRIPRNDRRMNLSFNSKLTAI